MGHFVHYSYFSPAPEGQKPLNKVCVLCSVFGLEGFLFDWFGDIQPKIVRLNLGLGQTQLFIMKNC